MPRSSRVLAKDRNTERCSQREQIPLFFSQRRRTSDTAPQETVLDRPLLASCSNKKQNLVPIITYTGTRTIPGGGGDMPSQGYAQSGDGYLLFSRGREGVQNIQHFTAWYPNHYRTHMTLQRLHTVPEAAPVLVPVTRVFCNGVPVPPGIVCGGVQNSQNRRRWVLLGY